MGTVFLVAGLFISESTPYTVSAYPAIPYGKSAACSVHVGIPVLHVERTSFVGFFSHVLRKTREMPHSIIY